MNEIDYNLLRMLPQEQAMAYLREKLAGGLGAYTPGEEGANGYYSGLGQDISVIPGYEGYVHMTEVDVPAPDARRNYTAVIPSGQEGRAYLAEFGPEGKLTGIGQQPKNSWWENEVFGVPIGALLPLAGAAAGAYFPGTELAAAEGAAPAFMQGASEAAVAGGPAGDVLAGGAGAGGAGAGATSGGFQLGSGLYGATPGYTLPTLAAAEAATLPALTPAMTSLGYTALPGAAALGAGAAGLAAGPGAAGTMSFLDASKAAIAGGAPAGGSSALGPLEKLAGKAGDWLVKKATDPATLAAAAMTALGGGSPNAATGTAGPARTPAQQEVFDRKPRSWDWDQMQRDAAAAGMTLPQYMARNWNRVSAGGYNKPLAMQTGGAVAGRPGGLGQVARLARGGGSGRADTIPARLSDGEYVMDAETVALLGDGSTDEGARRLDAMRSQVRAHKGRALAAGKFSPDAKSPVAYMKGRK